MPQKTIFTKYPLLSLPHSFLSCGLIRTDDALVQKLYQKTQYYTESPSVWEGAFRLAALLKDDPISEPVTGRILEVMAESGDGSFCGRIEDQIAVARAALAVFEYNTDRAILKRIASWCRYLEVEWDQLLSNGRTLFCPADLMELLVRFYQASGIKSVLRLCAKLRSTAFDWTTALHTIQQIMPLKDQDAEQIGFINRIGTDELDYDQKQVLLNHAETLADGVRYSVYSGIFSGNRQDLTAGRTAWNYLKKHHGAICGGTTAEPFLGGAGSNAKIFTEALTAWTEAFASEMLLPGSEWAVDELIRIIYNGLSYCLKTDRLPKYQCVNSINSPVSNEEAGLYAKAARAVAAAFRSGITVTETGIRINCLLPARYLLMVRKQPVILLSDGQKIVMNIKEDTTIPVAVFRSATETASIFAVNGSEEILLNTEADEGKNGRYLPVEKTWHAQDRISFEQDDSVYSESTHHQGAAWFVRNRLMAAQCGNGRYNAAVAEKPVIRNGKAEILLYRIEGWHEHHGEPEDIPVLPGHYQETEKAELVPYDSAEKRISMFPRINPLCLK
jgi:hypothetical protein